MNGQSCGEFGVEIRAFLGDQAAGFGPGTAWVQSLPFIRLAGRILANIGPRGGKDEGSLLGNFANIFERRG